MTETEEGGVSATGMVRRRLTEARWVLVAAAVAIVALGYAGDLSFAWIALAVAFVVLVAALARRKTSRRAREEADAAATLGFQGLSAQALAEAVPDPMIVFDQHGIVVTRNEAARSAFGKLDAGTLLNLRFRTPEFQDLLATLLAFLMGAIGGLYAATRGGWLDTILGRVADVIMSVPSLIFALLMLSIFGTNLAVIVIVVAVIYSPRVFRLSRAVAGNVVVMDYIEAAKLRGEGTWYLIRREILPNSTAPLIAEFGLEFCFVFLLIAGLSFLGLGIQPPTADWGSMVRENATLISFGDITPLIPAAAIALLTVAVNFVVDWMLFRSSGLKEQ